MVKSAQNQNGLRHNDYGRYHKYCIRKIYRVKKSLRFTSTSGGAGGANSKKQQFVKRVVTAEDAKRNPKHLHLLVFKSEANWAYAMQMRQIISGGATAASQAKAATDQDLHRMANRNPNRLKFHAIKRLQKAYQTAQQFLAVARESLDAYSQVEVEAYVAQISAQYQMDIKDYKSAFDNLLKSKIIYEKISQYKDTLEAIIYKEKIGQLDTLIRLCSFNLKGLMSGAEEEKLIAKMVSEYPERQSIEEQISKVKSETKREQIENIEEISYNNKTIPLKTEKLKQVFKRVETHLHDI
jgi:signal recognition particle subunit SRP68